jgi:hypothetical protein
MDLGLPVFVHFLVRYISTTIAFSDVGRQDFHVFFIEFLDTSDDDSSDDDTELLAAA